MRMTFGFYTVNMSHSCLVYARSFFFSFSCFSFRFVL